ncbi:MAG: hypothetical protein V1799_07595 [bacterium]
MSKDITPEEARRRVSALFTLFQSMRKDGKMWICEGMTDNDVVYGFKLVHKTNGMIVNCKRWAGKKHLSIRGEFPKDMGGYEIGSDKIPMFEPSFEQDPQRLCTQIVSRFMPLYEAVYDESMKNRQDMLARKEEQERIGSELANIVGETLKEDKFEFYDSERSLNIRCRVECEGTVRLEMTLPHTVANDMLVLSVTSSSLEKNQREYSLKQVGRMLISNRCWNSEGIDH